MPESPTADPSPSQQAAYPPPPGSQPPATPDDLADFFSTPAAAPPTSSSGARPSSTAHIDDMFSAAPKPNVPASRPQPAASPAAASAGAGSRQGQGGPGGSVGAGAGVKPTPKPAPKAAPTSMIDFGDEAALLAENPDLYKGLEEVPGNTKQYSQQSALHLFACRFVCWLLLVYSRPNPFMCMLAKGNLGSELPSDTKRLCWKSLCLCLCHFKHNPCKQIQLLSLCHSVATPLWMFQVCCLSACVCMLQHTLSTCLGNPPNS